MRDYIMGEHLYVMRDLLSTFGEDFLTEKEIEQYNTLKTSDPKKAKALLGTAAFPRLEPLWYYTVSLCRALFEGENRLTPEDAYWMGIIDEVIGTNLVGFRIVAEQETTPKPVPSPAAQGGGPQPATPAT
jgi:hypothetical protein